jgi:hypothetical protein
MGGTWHLDQPFIDKAKNIVYNYALIKLDVTDTPVKFSVEDDVYIVWFSKTLQNWKALVSTTLPDGRYYEVTYDGNLKRAYLDVYVKLDNVVVEDGG